VDIDASCPIPECTAILLQTLVKQPEIRAYIKAHEQDRKIREDTEIDSGDSKENAQYNNERQYNKERHRRT
jgi:hypothetical protein